jgi:hypothetical protein
MRIDHADDAPFSFAAGPFQRGGFIATGSSFIILHAVGASSKEATMQVNLRSPELTLQAGQVLTLDDAQGVRILSRTGTVWITQEGSTKDDIVGPGDALVVARNGRTVVQALRTAWISIGDGPRAANDPFEG